MDLIYADVVNGTIKDIGIMNTYSFDFSYGEKENDFQLKIPMLATELHEDMVVYINDTEFGGIIDAIEVDTENRMMIYTGRTWQGILENKVLYPLPGYDYMYVNGEANQVMGQLLERMNILPGDENELIVPPTESFIKASEEDSGIMIEGRITSESGNYAHGYTFIRNLLYENDAKPIIKNGVLSVVPLIDYSNDDDFLEGTDQFRAKRNYNSLNRLHCMGSGNLADRYTIDLYLDINGGLLPYCRENPVQDSDYYTDLKALSESTDPEDIENYKTITDNMVTGLGEIADIYDYPSIQNTFHHVLLTEEPDDWRTDLTPSYELKDKEWGFQKYFQTATKETGMSEYVQVSKPDLADAFILQLAMPADWMGNFKNYYTSGANGFEPVQEVEQYVPQMTQPADWYAGGYANYYQLVSGSYRQVEQVPGLVPLPSPPGDWATNWSAYANADGSRVQGVVPEPQYFRLDSQPPEWNDKYMNFYTTDGTTYSPVSGDQKKYKELTTVQPSDWKRSYKNYYKKSGSKWVHVSGSKAPQWKQNTYYIEKTKQVAPPFRAKKPADRKTYYYKVQDPEHAPDFVANRYYSNGYVIPTWGTITVYRLQTVPTWTTNTYYTMEKYQPIPQWIPETFFIRYEDHYEALIEAAKKKLESYQKKDELSIKLDERREYDINDRIGASDEVTGIGAIERITQKIVKIERGIISFKYSTGK